MAAVSNRFQGVFKNLFPSEGGYVNDPVDPGGETNYGISKRSYPNTDIKNLTYNAAMQIYWNDFWLLMGCDQLPLGLDEFLFDFGVNSGASLAMRKLQGAVGSLPDGKFGPNTLAAVKRSNVRTIVRLLFVERAIIMASQPKPQFDRFCHGWFARLHDKAMEFFTTVKVS